MRWMGMPAILRAAAPRLSPAPPLLLLLLLAPLAAAEDLEKDTLDGMDAEVRGDWVGAAQAFARAAEAAPGDLRRAMRLRMARQRGIAFWKPQIDLLFKSKRLDDAAFAVMVATLIDPGNALVASSGRMLEKAGVKIPGPPPAGEPVSKLFPNRSAAGRLRAWSTLGAPFGRGARLIDDGIAFLLKTQEEKGGWDSKKHGGWWSYDPAVTGLALEALLVDGPGGLTGDRGIAARRAADYLSESQAENGSFGTGKGAFFYCTLIATEALAEYAAILGDPDRYGKTLRRARDYIADAQNPGSGWRYQPRCGESDTSLTARAVCALHALGLAGFDPPGTAMRDAMKWIESMTEPTFGQIGYIGQGGLPARPEGKQELFPAERTHSMTAAGLLATCYIGDDPQWIPKAVSLISSVPPDSRYPDMYYWELGSRAYVAACGSVPPHWYAALVDAAVSCARPDGGMADCDVWQGDGGRIYATAMTVLALAGPFREPPPKSDDVTASAFLGKGKRSVGVAADAAETPTGIYAEPGMTILVTASGTIQTWVGSPRVPVDGIKHDIKAYRPLVKGAPFGCLLGRIGPEGKPFRVQVDKPFSLNACGQLFLLVNDERPEDGTGVWSVEVRLDR